MDWIVADSVIISKARDHRGLYFFHLATGDTVAIECHADAADTLVRIVSRLPVSETALATCFCQDEMVDWLKTRDLLKPSEAAQ